MADLYALSERLLPPRCGAGVRASPVGLFHPDGFFYDQHIERSKTILIPDRNVVSRMAQLARGRRVEADQQVRTAAGLLAFAQCLDIEIEPSVAFHELAHTAGNEAAWDELGWFRSADNARVHDVWTSLWPYGSTARARTTARGSSTTSPNHSGDGTGTTSLR